MLVLDLETQVSNTIQVSSLMLLFPEIAHKADYEGIWGLLTGGGLKDSLQLPHLNTFLKLTISHFIHMYYTDNQGVVYHKGFYEMTFMGL